jgi:pilus assembly protein CpaC
VTTRRLLRSLVLAAAMAALALVSPRSAAAQVVVREPTRVLSMAKGASLLLVNPVNFQRYTVGDPGIAEPIVVSPTELLVNGKGVGTTSLILWDPSGAPRLYTVEVTVDAAGLQRYIQSLLPGENIIVQASGNSVTLSGSVNDPNSVERAVEVAKGTGATVIDNLVAPPAVQVMLRVRFAEINRSAIKDISWLFNAVNTDKLDLSPRNNYDWEASSFSDGLVRFFLSSPDANIEGIIRASISKGNFKLLAEPNLLTLPGKQATFLAGGEFPYPSLQGASGNNAVSITFKEFGVKLNFTPYITRSGAIRLIVAPEVSSLDFANGLVINGFEIPSVLTRKAATEVELGEGQYLAMAGLMDNRTIENVTKIPILGDIPILGEFFKSRSLRANNTELLVLVTPMLVRGSNTAPAVPTGEVNTWKEIPGWMKEEMAKSPMAPKGPTTTPQQAPARP